MPKLKEIKIENGKIGLWSLTESPEDLINILPEGSEDLLLYNKISYEKRKVEFLATRALLSGLLGYYPTIKYHPDGRPFLAGSSLELSISHSKNLLAIITHKYHVGIDVEIEGRNVEKIASKFMSPNELNNVSGSPDFERYLLLHWCAKEAVFKCTKHEGIDFRSQICIDKFKISQQGTLLATLKKEQPELLKLFYIFFENNAIAWCYQSKQNNI